MSIIEEKAKTTIKEAKQVMAEARAVTLIIQETERLIAELAQLAEKGGRNETT